MGVQGLTRKYMPSISFSPDIVDVWTFDHIALLCPTPDNAGFLIIPVNRDQDMIGR